MDSSWAALVAKLDISEKERALALTAARWLDAQGVPFFLSRNIEVDKEVDKWEEEGGF